MRGPRHEKPAIDPQERIGNASPEDREIRMRCLVEAREQSKIDTIGYADILYRARLNARFVLSGETPELQPAKPGDQTEGGTCA